MLLSLETWLREPFQAEVQTLNLDQTNLVLWLIIYGPKITKH